MADSWESGQLLKHRILSIESCFRRVKPSALLYFPSQQSRKISDRPSTIKPAPAAAASAAPPPAAQPGAACRGEKSERHARASVFLGKCWMQTTMISPKDPGVSFLGSCSRRYAYLQCHVGSAKLYHAGVLGAWFPYIFRAGYFTPQFVIERSPGGDEARHRCIAK
jgi:hypothetical protein